MKNSMNSKPKRQYPKVKKFVKEEPLLNELSTQNEEIANSTEVTPNIYALHRFKLSDQGEEIKNQIYSTPFPKLSLRSRINEMASNKVSEKKEENKNESDSKLLEAAPK